jgi:hypothetical protein
VRKLLFVFILFTFYLSPAQPTWQWAQSGTCTTSDNGSAITTDINGNVYTTGYFFGSNLTFSSTTLINSGNYDAFVVKHDNNGNFLWARAIGGAFDDVSNAIVCDNNGNVFVTGYYSSNTLTIGTSTLVNLGGTDVFVAKFDPNGNAIWAKSFGDNMIEESNAITCDGNNIYLTGQFQSNFINFGTGTLTCNGGGDVFVTKYDNNGNEIWGRSFGDAGLDIAYGISTKPGSDIYVTGGFRSANLAFATTTVSNNGGSDFFLARYDVSGNEIWMTSEGGNFDDVGTAVHINAFGVYVCGYYKSTTINFGTTTYTNVAVNSTDVFIINYNYSGSINWSNAFGGNFDDIPYGVTADYLGNVFFAGHIHSSAMVMGTYTLNCNGIGDSFIAKLNLAGALMWAENIGGLQDDGIGSLAIDGNGKIFAAGFYISSSVSFGTNTLNNTGSSDLFIAKLDNIPTDIEQQTLNFKAQTIYPNPASSGFTINSLSKNSHIHIFDMSGKELLRFEIPNSPQLFIDTQTLPAGIYFVKVLSKESSSTHKLSVIR